MRILKIDEKQKTVVVKPEILDDFWHLLHVIEPGDMVKGKTSRKLKGEAGKETIREHLFLELECEKLDFSHIAGEFRVSGIIVGGKPADKVELKSHHSLNFELGQNITVQKKTLKGYQLERLKKAQKATHKEKILAVLADDEEAGFFVMKEFGVDNKGVVRSKKSGKQFEGEDWKGVYFSAIRGKLERVGSERVLIAGPGFIKDELRDYLDEKGFKGKVFLASTNNVGLPGLNELMKSGAMQKVVQETEFAREAVLMEKAMEELGKDSGLVAYGVSEVGKAVDFGAVGELLVADKMLLENREKLEELMAKAEKRRAKVHIISCEADAGKKLLGLTGVAALLRFRVE